MPECKDRSPTGFVGPVGDRARSCFQEIENKNLTPTGFMDVKFKNRLSGLGSERAMAEGVGTDLQITCVKCSSEGFD